jgi:hypothetical protein
MYLVGLCLFLSVESRNDLVCFAFSAGKDVGSRPGELERWAEMEDLFLVRVWCLFLTVVRRILLPLLTHWHGGLADE